MLSMFGVYYCKSLQDVEGIVQGERFQYHGAEEFVGGGGHRAVLTLERWAVHDRTALNCRTKVQSGGIEYRPEVSSSSNLGIITVGGRLSKSPQLFLRTIFLPSGVHKVHGYSCRLESLQMGAGDHWTRQTGLSVDGRQ